MARGKDSRPRDSRRYLPVMFSPVVSLRTLQIQIPEGKDVTFISDVHLGFGSRESDKRRERRLIALLGKVAQRTTHLIIVGDLFDFWFDYRRSIPKHHVRTLACLHNMVDAGIPITYLMGNHDFGHWRYFQEELGINVDKGDLDATIGSKRFYISHGDGKATNDGGYLFLRSILRNRAAQTFYRWLHPDLGIWLASGTSHGSREYTAAKDFGSDDGLKNFATAKINEGYDVVVMGHRHRSAYERIGNGLYVNLGDWIGNDPTYGVYTEADGMKLISVID